MRPRVRALAALAAGALAAATAVATGAPARAAVPSFQAVVTCDRATDTVTTGTTGGRAIVPGTPVRVDFRFRSGTAVRSRVIEPVPAVPPVSANATVAADGTLTTTGYTRAWQSASYEFWTETVDVSVYHRTTGQLITTRQATCTADTRTEVTLECDPVARTVTARARGTGYPERESATYPPFGSVYVRWFVVTTWQLTEDGERWTSQVLGPSPDYTHAAPLTGGAWSDLGHQRQLARDYHYYAEKVRVEVVSGHHRRVIGGGTASCVYADGGA
jgi:hypothetical protein